MRCYKVKVQGTTKIWAGSMAECREAKAKLAIGDTTTRQVTYEETEVPTNKADLLGWLNKNCVE
jgi:hypothetical protein